MMDEFPIGNNLSRKNALGFCGICLALFLVSTIVGCAQTGINKTAGGALTGSALGAGMGAIIGSQSGHAGPGTAIGAAAGALGGAIIGNSLQNQDEERLRLEEQQLRQEEENRRINRELEELRRNQRYDDTYRRY